MGMFVNGRPIGKVFLGSEVIKEAYINGRPVFVIRSSGPVPKWQARTYYYVGDTVEHNGTTYRCTSEHQASNYYEPGAGARWEDFWNAL